MTKLLLRLLLYLRLRLRLRRPSPSDLPTAYYPDSHREVLRNLPSAQ